MMKRGHLITLIIVGVIVTAAIIIANLINSIVKDPTDEIAKQIERANRDCPIPAAGGMGQVTAIKLEDKLIAFYLDFKPGYADIDALQSDSDATRDMLYLSFIALQAQGNSFKEEMDKLLKNGIGFKINITDGNGRSFNSILTPEYIADMNRKMLLNPSEALYNALLLKLRIESLECPVELERGIFLTEMTLEDNSIIAILEFDEELYDMEMLNKASNTFCYSLLEEANNGDPELGALFDLCKVSHAGLVWRAIGNQSGKQCDLSISSEDIRRYRKTPPQINLH